MIKFLGQCVQNLIIAIKYMLDGRVRFGAVLSSATSIGYDSIPIALAIVFIASAVISLQISKQFLLSGGDSYVGGFMAVALIRELPQALRHLRFQPVQVLPSVQKLRT